MVDNATTEISGMKPAPTARHNIAVSDPASWILQIMGIMNLVQVLAIIIGPALAPAFSAVNIPLWGPYKLNGLTLPGHFSSICSLISLILLFFFKEIPRPPTYSGATPKQKSTFKGKVATCLAPETNTSPLGVWTCVVLSFTSNVSYTVFEVVGPQLCHEVRRCVSCS